MITSLLNSKGSNIRDCEFIINVCDNPIVNYLDGKRLSPDIFNVNINDTDAELLPILSSFTSGNYRDITLPDYLSYSIASNIYYPTITNNNKYNCTQNRYDDARGTIDNNLLSLFINYSGVSIDPRRNLRLKVINSLPQIKESLLNEGCTLEEHFLSNGLKTIFPNIIEGDGQLESLEDKNLGNFNELEYDYMIDGSGKIPRALLYIDGVGSDFILTKMLSMGIPIIRLKGNIDHIHWYEKLFIEYNLSDSVENNSDANIITINSIENITEAWKVLKNTVAYNNLKTNTINLKDIIFNNEIQFDYLEFLLNEISFKLNSNSVKNIDKNILENSNIMRINVREDLVGSIIGVNGSNLNKIKVLTNTDISIKKADETGAIDEETG